jgi:protein ImuA
LPSLNESADQIIDRFFGSIVYLTYTELIMRLVSCHNGRILTSALADENIPRPKVFTTGLPALDDLAPAGGFVRGAVHEILSQSRRGVSRFFATLLARSAAQSGAIVWSDPRKELYPPAVAAMGIPLKKLYLLHPQSVADQTWAIAECMRCRGVAATIAQVGRLSRVEARRFQLAAESGGGVGILLRKFDKSASIYAAATRWLVAPEKGERTVQRWKIQLIHGHGGRIGEAVILEHHRENFVIQAHLLREAAELADRSVAQRAVARASA